MPRKMLPYLDFSVGSTFDIALAGAALSMASFGVFPDNIFLFVLSVLLLVIRIVYGLIRISQALRHKNEKNNRHDETGDQ